MCFPARRLPTTRFNALVVRLKARRSCATVATSLRFNALVVRLKGVARLGAHLSLSRFNALVVRLKGAVYCGCSGQAVVFQCLSGAIESSRPHAEQGFSYPVSMP